ncbi:MAG: hypothetical protein JWM00_604 [Candidatus Saccharibacteria bacterium]|nr:hypothetical protein [Candidatus Saccharibacteria bacterium]
MWNYFLPTKNYSKMGSTNIASGDGRRFLLLSTLALLTVPATVLGAYDFFSPDYQNTPESTNQKSLSPLDALVPEAASSVTTQTSIDAHANSSSPNTTTQLEVNNQRVDIPNNGSVSKTITDSNGTTKIDVSVNAESTESSHTYSSTNIQLNTTSESQSSSSSGSE